MPDHKPGQMTEDDASDVALGWLQLNCSELFDLLAHQLRQSTGVLRQPVLGETAARTTNKDRINDGRAGAVDVN